MRNNVLVALLTAMAVGCAHSTAVVPDAGSTDWQASQGILTASDNPHRLWGEWTWYISSAHDQIDIVPKREGRFHLNALKFLESYCADCLKILSITNNGDSTVDIVVRITHPFKGHPEFTGFDVKGILMFSASYEYPSYFSDQQPYPEPYRISWRLKGDPELMNPDGWTMRWSPTWDSGSDMPIFNYWPGKFSSGTPTANLNGFKNFYTNEERHMFAVDSSVERTYTVWLPEGKPIVAGYAVEACWEPATVQPVTDPLNDFPYSANQPEPYVFNVVLNNGDPIKDESCCYGYTPLYDCGEIRIECARWDGIVTGIGGNTYVYYFFPNTSDGVGALYECSPEQIGSYWVEGFGWGQYENGHYREVAMYCQPPTDSMTRVVLDVYDFTVDKE